MLTFERPILAWKNWTHSQDWDKDGSDQTGAQAANGRESVALVTECRPDVVLMDMQMPVMDGVEATRRIKEQWPMVRVLALTIHAKYRAQALAAGADAFLLKESNPDTLLGAILAKADSPP